MLNLNHIEYFKNRKVGCRCGSTHILASYDYKPKWFIGFKEWYDMKCVTCGNEWRIDKK